MGIIPLAEPLSLESYQEWLAKDFHGEMAYLENHLALRQDPRTLLEGAQFGLVFALPYYQGEKLTRHRTGGAPIIAQYARFKDYHRFLRQKLERIAAKLGPRDNFRICVDSAPLLEKAIAARTELGFIGKNTLYIHPEAGSFLLLGEILTTMAVDQTDQKIAVDPKKRTSQGGCGSCRRCQVYCPTGALSSDYTLDSRKCLSYLTIEHRSPVPVEYWRFFKTYFFGCDLCQLACPYNKGIKEAQALPLAPSLEDLDLFQVACMDQEYYEKTFGGTPVTRAKRVGLKRNALIAMVALNHPRLSEAILAIRQENEPLLQATVGQIPEFYSLSTT